MHFVLCSIHLRNQHFNKKAISSDVVHTINKFKHLFNKMFALFRPTVCFTKEILDKRNLQKLYLSVFLPRALGGFFPCTGIFRVNAKEERIGTLPRASSKPEFLLTITGIPAEKASRPVNPNPSVLDGISTRSTSQNR